MPLASISNPGFFPTKTLFMDADDIKPHADSVMESLLGKIPPYKN
jgi:hypothetical protein